MLLNTTLSMNELFGSEAKHSSFTWYSSFQSKNPDAKYSNFPWHSSSPSRNSFFPSCSSQSADSLIHKFRYIFKHGPYDLGFKNKHAGINHDQVGTKCRTEELIFGRHSFWSKNLDHNPTLTKLASYKSSILKFLYSMKPENCSAPNILCNLNHYHVPSPSAAASGISASLKRTSCFLLSLGALRHYPLKPTQIMLYKAQLTRCIKHVNHHRTIYMVGLGFTIVLATLWETVPYSNRKHLVIIPASKDKSFGDYLSKMERVYYKILPSDHPHSVRVRSISNKILEALQSDLKIKQMNDLEFGSMNINGNFDEEKQVKLPWWRRTKFSTRHLEGLNWEVVVSDEYSASAHAQPGGRIVVHDGLLQCFTSDAEIAAVISHEVGHVVARHTAEDFTKILLFVIGMLIILLGSAGRSPPPHPLGMKKLGELILNPGYRRREKEADYIGMLLMASAGYDPRVAPKMHEMLDENDDSDSKYSALFSTHPSGKKRSEALSKPKVMKEAMTRFSKATGKQLRTD
ncbi:Mitochondrial metalloendopeptidase OMA1 [Heracleum sosnowskyi]|uniref:Mitochondrial metalloendopeptidase OMA1 n=1 Tax=Heracleum sosnowskyi TaxID=360622 RepID=A0AAD8I1X9_9APIA|nr:Mitochondrial metalloendopeptidase OMA1 [Heracleum sosnowskyi]